MSQRLRRRSDRLGEQQCGRGTCRELQSETCDSRRHAYMLRRRPPLCDRSVRHPAYTHDTKRSRISVLHGQGSQFSR